MYTYCKFFFFFIFENYHIWTIEFTNKLTSLHDWAMNCFTSHTVSYSWWTCWYIMLILKYGTHSNSSSALSNRDEGGILGSNQSSDLRSFIYVHLFTCPCYVNLIIHRNCGWYKAVCRFHMSWHWLVYPDIEQTVGNNSSNFYL